MLFAKGQKVLIVDDERWTSDTLATIFNIARYEARAAYSAEDALEIVKDWKPQLAILDVMLPKMNGIDLALQLYALAPGCRILLFSGNPHTPEIVEAAARDGHSFDVLQKPVHPDIMLGKATQLLALR